jgi:hypothetical protein
MYAQRKESVNFGGIRVSTLNGVSDRSAAWSGLQVEYFHKDPGILHGDLWRESHQLAATKGIKLSAMLLVPSVIVPAKYST